MQSFDIAIIGAGMVGLTLANALSGSGLTVAVLDQAEPDVKWASNDLSFDPSLRVSALNMATQKALERCGAWSSLSKQRMCAYQSMDVREQDSFARIAFSHQEVNLPQLGYIAENAYIQHALWQRAVQNKDIQLIAPSQVKSLHLDGASNVIQLQDDRLIQARLVVGADGGRSIVRTQAAFPVTFSDYGQQAIVATIRTELPHQLTARQVFTPTGPLAFLPLWHTNLCSIVWSQDAEQANRLMALPEVEFEKQLATAFNMQLGLCKLESERQTYPLRMQLARKWLSDGVVIIGDAAHTIHPLAGQGANLGIQDAIALADALIDIKVKELDIGDSRHLRAFERWRKAEASEMVATMEGFKQLFAGSHPVKKLIRGVGMSLTNQLTPIKQQLIARAVGLNTVFSQQQ